MSCEIVGGNGERKKVTKNQPTTNKDNQQSINTVVQATMTPKIERYVVTVVIEIGQSGNDDRCMALNAQ